MDRSNDPVSEWYALSTEPQRERVAGAGLAERYISFFLPMQRQWAMERGRITDEFTYSPLFQGYIFALLQVRQMADVLAIEGICRFVRLMDNTGEQRPFPIPALEIIRLQAEERRGGFDLTVNKAPAKYRPKKGDQVLVISGPYLTLRGEVLGSPGASRVMVGLEDGRTPMLQVSQLMRAS